MKLDGTAPTTTRLAEASDAWPDKVWRPARWVLLLVLLLSFVTTLLRVVPASGSTRSLVADIKAGRTHTVQMDAADSEVTVRWSTGLLDDHSYVYKPTGFVLGPEDAVHDFTTTVTRATGPSAEHVRFSDFDAAYGAGGLTLLVPIAYALLTPWPWLRFLAILTGGLVLARMLTARRHRLASGPVWMLAALLTGTGFFGYLWAEPGTWASSAVSAPRRWWRAWLVALATGAGMAVTAVLVLFAAGRF
ncbi:hypothetical protein [Streptomyces sp. TP-A0356]|uniref:hypothetical protein n=1 Tax=Streptomyces sp. TP-A0356 TaxID=1359208 RepID=UPI0006E2EA68|nr:hypothetical protein [Streptomyces sp. TP-A0356]